MKEKICVLCGKLFVPKTNAQKICQDEHYRNCEICGKPFKIIRPSNSQLCCSKQCTAEKRKRTMKSRYGVEYAQQSQEIRKKSEATNIEKFGYAHPAQSPLIKEKERRIFQERYGVDTPFLMEDFQSKRKKTCLEKYGVEHPLQTEQSLNRMKDSYKKVCLEKFGVPYACLTEQCKNAQPGLISTINKQFGNLLLEHNIPYKFEKVIEDKSFDIELLDRNVLIEIDPTYTHSTVPTHWGYSKDAKSQLEKTQVANKNGYRCIHIFDWDNWDKIIDLISDKTTVYARNCEVKQISETQASEFEQKYHIQSACRGQLICFGLYHKNKLIQIMTFGKPRYNKQYQWELLRLCTKSEYKIIGGSERLFKHFVNTYDPQSIISYCDIAKFTGEVYLRLGFELHHHSGVAKIWSKNKSKITDNLLRQRGYDQLFNSNYGKGTDNETLMLEHGWLPIYDCGQNVYTWKKGA